MDYLKEQVNKVGSRLHLLLLLLCCAACSDRLDEVSPGTPVAVSVSVGGMEGYETAATRGAEAGQRFVCREEGKPALQVAITPQTATTRGDADTRALGEGIYFRLLVKNNATGALADYVDYRYTSAGVVAVGGKQLVLPAGNTYLFGAYTYNSTAPITDVAALSIGDIGPDSGMRVWQSQPMLLQGPLDLPILFRPLTSGLAVRFNTAGAGGLDALAGIDAASVTRSKATWALGLAVTSGGDDAWRTVFFNSPSSWADPTRVTSSCSPVLPQTNGTLVVYFNKLATQDIVLTGRWVTLTGVTLLPGVSYVCDITVSSEGEEEEEEVKVETLGETAETRANCYIVTPGKRYVLNAEYEGNGVGWDGTTATPNIPVGTTVPGTPAGALLVWQSVAGLITDVKYQAGGISFKTTNARTQFVGQDAAGGNAVVAVTDAGGGVLWSWHLWVVDSEMTKIAINTGAGDGNRYMDRNLGALGNTPESKVLAYGMLYQWGRKDPLPGSSQFAANTEPTLYDAAGAAMQVSKPNPSPGSTVAVATQYPVAFLIGEDWLSPSNNYLWGHISNSQNTKTRYDPCPAGWKVPPWDAYSSASTVTGPWSADGKGRTFAALGGWFPAVGYQYSYVGTLYNVGMNGCFWTSSPYGTTYGYQLYFFSSDVGLAGYDRADGCGLRCSQE